MADRSGRGRGQGQVGLLHHSHGYNELDSDESTVRSEEEPSLPLPLSHDQISHKDIVFDREKGLWARIYLPPQSTPNQRFPLIIYFHGGGFCCYSPATPAMHRLCLTWASHLVAIIVSVNYRLAPEHRLPAAYEDSIQALQWLHSQSGGDDQVDPWLVSHADYSKVFVAGDSAGGNIAHHVGMWAADPANGTLSIKAMILLFPFFGAEERTASETRSGGGQVFTLDMSDAAWKYALPAESNRDHPYCNPLSALPRSHEGGNGSVELKLPPMLFVIAGEDILRDRQVEYCEVLKKSGKREMEVHVFEEEDHGFAVLKRESPNSAKALRSISDFIKRQCCS